MAKAKKKRSAKQIAATKKMSAANKAAKAGRKAAKKAAKKSKPKARPKAKSSKGKRAAVKTATKARKQSGATKGKRKMKKGKRRAARAGMKKFIKNAGSMALGGVAGGTVATALDVVVGWDKTPAVLKTPLGAIGTRSVGAFIGGMAVEKMTGNSQLGRDTTVGAIGALVNSVERGLIKQHMPALPLGEVSDLSEALGFGNADNRLADEIAGLAAAIDDDYAADALAYDQDDDDEDDGIVLDGLGGDLIEIY